MTAFAVAATFILGSPLCASTLDITAGTAADFRAAYATGRLSSEQVVKAYLARIHAYDQQGPNLQAVVLLNPSALDDARKLDRARAAGTRPGPLDGIPILLKDNIDAAGLPTTAGSQLLEGNLASVDAAVVARLRRAGAIILAKVNMSEFAGSGGSITGSADPSLLKAYVIPNGYSSLGLQTRNPHDPSRGPAGSSGGTGAALAAAFGLVGLGTDTGGSVRMPASANGIVGLKPTRGLLSRSGVVPLSLTLDTVGPMGRTVADVALTLGAMTGVDHKDESTTRSEGRFLSDYSKFLKRGSLRGARIGVARNFMGKSSDTDAVMEQSIDALRRLGAEVIDPTPIPDYLVELSSPAYNMLVATEFKSQMNSYLERLGPGYPRSFIELVEKANDPATLYRSPAKALGLRYQAETALTPDDPQYLALKNEQFSAIRTGIDAVFMKYNLDAIVYPTLPRPPPEIQPKTPPTPGSPMVLPTILASATGLPDIAVPAGMTESGLPVTISFMGREWTDGELMGFAYDFEQEVRAIRLPRFTPTLQSDIIEY